MARKGLNDRPVNSDTYKYKMRTIFAWVPAWNPAGSGLFRNLQTAAHQRTHVTLPIKSPYSPMEALSVEEVPGGAQWQYEPKSDGFRCLVFRDETVVNSNRSPAGPDALFP